MIKAHAQRQPTIGADLAPDLTPMLNILFIMLEIHHKGYALDNQSVRSFRCVTRRHPSNHENQIGLSINDC